MTASAHSGSGIHKRHYLVLDAARGLAALAVMLYHIRKYIYPEIGTDNYLYSSYIAVDLFFLMSGLVIAYSYERRMLEGLFDFPAFCKVRFIRLYPLYLAGLLLGVGYDIIKMIMKPAEAMPLTEMVRSFGLNLLFMPNFYGAAGIYPFDAAAWSLALEWAINIVYAAWAVRQSSARLLGLAVLAGGWLAGAAVSYGSLDMGWGVPTLGGGVLRICFSFTLGVVFYRWLERGTLPLPRISAFLLLGLLGAILLVPPNFLGVYYDLLCVVFLFPVFVLLGCVAPVPDKWRSGFSLLGGQSYAIYILHTPLMLWFGGIWKQLAGSEPAARPWVSAPLLVGFILLASYLATRFYDEPIRRFLTRSLKRTSVSQA